MNIDRRHFIRQLSGLVATGAYLKLCGIPSAFSAVNQTLGGLAKTARENGREFGCCVSTRHLNITPQYNEVIKNDCTIVVPESLMKWKNLNPKPGVYDFYETNKITTFAEKNDIKMRFHALVWHQALPDWLERSIATKTDAEKELRTYADNILPYYRGKMRSWDIVNEPIKIKHGNSGGLRSTIWYNSLGPDYVAYCFNFAKEYNLGGDLVLNEYGTERKNSTSKAKRQAFLALVRDLKEKDVPVDAVGLQSHLKIHEPMADRDEYQKWLEDIKDTGVKIFITELDIDERKHHGSLLERAHAGAAYVEEYLHRVHEVTTPEEILMWGIWDGKSFINEKVSPFGTKAQPLLYNVDWDKNPLWHTIEKILKNNY